jgi:hypothetical protein
MITILLILIVVNYIKNIDNAYKNFSNKEDIDQQIKDDILQYIQVNRPHELSRKTSSTKHLTDQQYLDIYLDSIIPLTKHETYRLKKLTKSIDQYIKKICTNSNYTKWVSKKPEWKYIKLGNNELEFNYPFSLGNYIYLRPHHFKYPDKRFKKLLLHEHIHVIQRNNQEHFNQQYIKHLPVVKTPNVYFEHTFYENIITNPDAPDSGWIVYLKNTNVLFVPALMLSDYKTTEVAILLNQNEYPKLYQDVLENNISCEQDCEITLSRNKTVPLYEMTEYIDMVNSNNGLYNPNEYLAHGLENTLYDDIQQFNDYIMLYF